MKKSDWIEAMEVFGDDDKPAPLRLLLYGEPGAGKTYLALGAPKPFVIDTDRGMQTAKTMGLKIPGVSLTKTDASFNIVRNILFALRDGKPPFDVDPPETVIIDSLTALCDYILWELMSKPDSAAIPRKDPLSEKAEYTHWAALQNRMRELLDITKDLPMHCIATAGVKTDEDSNGAIIAGKPAMQGSIRNTIGHYFDEFFYMCPLGSGEKLKYITYTRRYMNYAAKSRIGTKAKLEDLTFDQLLRRDEETN
jgi:hypothetical protein